MSISVNSKIIICYCPKECSALHWWAKQNDVYNKRCQHVYTFQKNNRVRHRVPYYFYRVIPARPLNCYKVAMQSVSVTVAFCSPSCVNR